MTDAERLVRIVRGFAGRSLAVLGDLVSDEFLYGEISRVSREAPVLILEHDRTVVVPGGGANSVVNIRALGATPIPVGVVGDDPCGSRLRKELARRRIDTTGLVVVENYETPSKCRVLAGGVHTRRQQIVRIDRGAHKGEFAERTGSALRKRLRAALRSCEGLLIADYGYGSASPAVVAPLLKDGIPIVTVDSRQRIDEFRGVSACTPNQEELERALGLDAIPESGVAAAGRRFLRRSGNQAVLVTRGARGMMLFRRGRPPLDVPAYGSDEVADVTGAGDTVIAAFTLALLSGAEPDDAARIANYAAGVVVTKAGTATITRAELIRAIRDDHAEGPDPAGGR